MAIIEAVKDFFKETEKQEIKLSDKDDILCQKLELRIEESNNLRKTRLQDWKTSLEFFIGNQWKATGITLPTYKADTFVNKEFAAIRSLIAYETDAKPAPVAEAEYTGDMAPERKQELVRSNAKMESMLEYKWETLQIPSKLIEIYYDRYLFDDGFGMYFWNNITDDVDFEIVKPQEILRSSGSTSIEDAEYVVVEKWRNRKYFDENYPDYVDKINYADESDVEPDDEFVEKSKRKNLAKVHYYFQDDIWIVKCGKQILEKKKNPFWEWRTEAEQAADIKERVGMIPTGWQPIRNHLRKPEKPIVQFKGYHLGGEFYSRSLMKQIISLSVALNKRKCQIQDIIDGMGNPQIAVDPSVPESEVRKITSKPGLKIRVNPDLIKSLPPAQPPTGTFEDMLHTERKIEDMFGLHEVSMGAVARKRMTKAETLTLKESDITPIRLLMRNAEVAMTKILNGWVQLMKLFYDQKHYIGKLGEKGIATYGEFLVREDIPDNLSIMIKVGSTMPVSKETRRSQYLRDFQLGAIALIDYLRFMEYPNPDELATNVQMQQAGQLVPPIMPAPGAAGTQSPKTVEEAITQ